MDNVQEISNSENIISTENDYYFNATAETEGNGSYGNPYKQLTNENLKDNSIIHLSNGDYELNKGKLVKNISIIGQDAKSTVIQFQNNNSILTVNGSLTLKNLTLIDVSIINYGTVNATNVIFKNSIAYNRYSEATNIVNSASNSFGGAIYSPSYTYSTEVFISNCTFINNTAEYGGAIYMSGGVLNIKNSIFLDNYAYNYGGAISCEDDSKINIEKSKFINSKSINDAGGAIYIKSSKLTANNISIENSKSTFGSAITSLSSTVSINNLYGFNNTARYEGGAIYQFYGSFTLRNSNLINNSANNGGALFIDNTTSTILYQNIFTNNSASSHGGAVYSLFNLKSRINYNEYYDNTAEIENDFYETSKINLIIGNGNYSLYKYNSTDFSYLPSNYSSLTNGFVTAVKDQQAGGNCWAFAGISVLESCILKASGENIDLSEENMKNLMGLYSDYGWYMETNGGGYPSMIMGYLLSWLGPVLDIDDSNDDYSTLSPLLDSVVHVQNIKYIKRTSYTDNDAIKEAVLKYGAVGTGIYFDYMYYNNETYSYYGSITTLTNHAVTIVGWDDNYSRKNFINRPRGDGAFLVKNSWGDDWGDNGYFYVSYYDTSFARVGDDEASYTFILNDSVKYDKNYQYDIPGKTDYFLTGNDAVWYQNIFEATDDEYLVAVSTYFEKQCKWDVYIYINDVLMQTKNGTADCGYYTIDLGEFIPLKSEDIFKVVFKITASESSFPICEKVRSNKVLYREGISFFSYDGENWVDLFNYIGYFNSHSYNSQVACIKAFTVLDKVQTNLSLNISNEGYNPVEITAKVTNQYGNLVDGGRVIFDIYGENYTVPVSNGFAKLTVNLKELAITNITAKFKAEGYEDSDAEIFANISKIVTNIEFKVNKNMTNALINIHASKSINETVNVLINNENYTLNLVNGTGILNLNDLEMGNYTVCASVLNNSYVTLCDNVKFTINVKNTKINTNDIAIYANSNQEYFVSLLDDFGNPISNCTISFMIDEETFSNVTDDNGTASVKLNLSPGNHDILVKFNGNEEYFNSSSSEKINVKSTIIPNKKEVYFFNDVYFVELLDLQGNYLNNTNITVFIENNEYNLTTDDNGSFSLKIDFKPCSYTIHVKNPINNENLTDTIEVSPRIVKNQDLKMYFNSGTYYKIRIIDDNGNYAGSNEIVKMTIAGKVYNVKTDEFGYAKLKINLKPKTYTVTAEYKGFKVSNKIVVKPVLTAKNISKKKAKTIKFSAKLVNTKGKVVKGKKITFKIKGKTYKVKTNKKGIATVSLKNLKVGKYTIKTTYGKSTIKNSIKIKK